MPRPAKPPDLTLPLEGRAIACGVHHGDTEVTEEEKAAAHACVGKAKNRYDPLGGRSRCFFLRDLRVTVVVFLPGCDAHEIAPRTKAR
jgi:hypothetical protein